MTSRYENDVLLWSKQDPGPSQRRRNGDRRGGPLSVQEPLSAEQFAEGVGKLIAVARGGGLPDTVMAAELRTAAARLR